MSTDELQENHTDTPVQPDTVPRRRLLGWLVGVINAGVIGAVVVPTLGFIAAPMGQKKPKGVWVPVIDAEELKDGEIRSVTYKLDVPDGYMVSPRNYSVYLSRKGRRVTAFDPTCPHLGCHVEFKDRKKRFVCPCHGGVFDDEGERVSGPPPKGLTKLAVKLEGGKVWIEKV